MCTVCSANSPGYENEGTPVLVGDSDERASVDHLRRLYPSLLIRATFPPFRTLFRIDAGFERLRGVEPLGSGGEEDSAAHSLSGRELGWKKNGEKERGRSS